MDSKVCLFLPAPGAQTQQVFMYERMAGRRYLKEEEFPEAILFPRVLFHFRQSGKAGQAHFSDDAREIRKSPATIKPRLR